VKNLFRDASAKSAAKSILMFLMHQFMGTWGVPIFTAFALTSAFDWLDNFGGHVLMGYVRWILTQNPYYPAQITIGLYLGWILGRRLKHRSMVWVWIIPLAILCYAVLTTPILVPEWTSVLAQPSIRRSRFSYYFGWGCRPADHCLDQLVITMPFYSSVAYSLGAVLAQKMARKGTADQLCAEDGALTHP
jgi:hypothetical protein